MDEEVKVAVQEILKCLQIKDLKTEQAKILKALLERRDCVAILPTGYGKSLPYQIAISVKRSLLRDEGEKIIVCCPLVALMKDQVIRLSTIPGIKATFKGYCANTMQVLRSTFV